MDRITFRAFNTVNVVSAHECPTAVFEEVERLCGRYEALFSHTMPDSDLNRVNGSAGRTVETSLELADLVARSLRYCEATDGLFDITMGPVVSLWDFHRGAVPDGKLVESALSHVDYRKVEVGKSSVRLADPNARITLGGIAKGYIADAVLDLLSFRGIEHAIVNLGGNVAVMGGKPDGSPFNVGIRAPISSKDGDESPVISIPLMNGSLVTSGTYERCFVRNGKRYHHILDPRTGYPATTNLESATIIARSSLDADGLSTAPIVAGLPEARKLIEPLEGIEAVFIDGEGTVSATMGVKLS